jgi:ABC-type glycerol-3-phosphate transport system permease component
MLPYELVEAARVDGCSEIGIFHKIVLPIMKPGYRRSSDLRLRGYLE